MTVVEHRTAGINPLKWLLYGFLLGLIGWVVAAFAVDYYSLRQEHKLLLAWANHQVQSGHALPLPQPSPAVSPAAEPSKP